MLTTERETYLAAYAAVLAKWPVTVDARDIATPFGTTRVNACGPADAPPLVLLHGSGCTSTVWFNNVEDLSRDHRVYAIDQINEAGLGELSRPPRTSADMLAWLDAVMGGLDLAQIDLCGHSYGGWLALSYAIHARDRVGRLVLLDPSTCFGGYATRYLVHATPFLLTGNGSALLRWETGGASFDPAFERLRGLPSGRKQPKIVRPRRPDATALRTLDVPTLVLLAADSKMHDVGKVATTARASMPNVDVRLLPGQTHHTMPMLRAADTDREIVDFCR